jgi:hypothetical protein
VIDPPEPGTGVPWVEGEDLPLPSPCRNVCRLGADGLCDGCGRTLAEIADWIGMPAVQRGAVMSRVQDWKVREPPRPPGE